MPAPVSPSRFSKSLPLVQSAAAHARVRHARQRRLDGSPFFEHTLEVAELLEEAGADDELIAAALLHDVLEKTNATERDLLARFGPRVTDLIIAVTDDDTITDWRKRKSASRGRLRRNPDQDAVMLFAADKISRIRELRSATGPLPTPPTPDERVAHYHACLYLVESRLPDSSLAAMLRAEVEAYERVQSAVSDRM